MYIRPSNKTYKFLDPANHLLFTIYCSEKKEEEQKKKAVMFILYK